MNSRGWSPASAVQTVEARYLRPKNEPEHMRFIARFTENRALKVMSREWRAESGGKRFETREWSLQKKVWHMNSRERSRDVVIQESHSRNSRPENSSRGMEFKERNADRKSEERNSAQSLCARVSVYLIKVEFLCAAIGGVDFDRVFIRRLNDGKVSPA